MQGAAAEAAGAVKQAVAVVAGVCPRGGARRASELAASARTAPADAPGRTARRPLAGPPADEASATAASGGAEGEAGAPNPRLQELATSIAAMEEERQGDVAYHHAAQRLGIE